MVSNQNAPQNRISYRKNKALFPSKHFQIKSIDSEKEGQDKYETVS